MTVHSIQSEAIWCGARMVRTALGPAIGRLLDDPTIVEVMLNSDGRLWIAQNLEAAQPAAAQDQGREQPRRFLTPARLPESGNDYIEVE